MPRFSLGLCVPGVSIVVLLLDRVHKLLQPPKMILTMCYYLRSVSSRAVGNRTRHHNMFVLLWTFRALVTARWVFPSNSNCPAMLCALLRCLGIIYTPRMFRTLDIYCIRIFLPDIPKVRDAWNSIACIRARVNRVCIDVSWTRQYIV